MAKTRKSSSKKAADTNASTNPAVQMDETQMTAIRMGVARMVLRMNACSFYDHQKVRLGSMNQLRDIIRRLAEGIPLDQPEDKKDKPDYSAAYADGKLMGILTGLFKDKKIGKQEYKMIKTSLKVALDAAKLEKEHQKIMAASVKQEPLWHEFLVHIKGIGEVLAANLLSRIGHCETYERISSLWRNFGYAVICPTCTDTIHDDKRDIDRIVPVCANNQGSCPRCGAKGVSQRKKVGRNLDFDPDLRVLGYKIGSCLIKASSPIYYDIYAKEKERLLARVYAPGELFKRNGKPYKPEDTQLSKGHASAMALRKMVKIFLSHYWVKSRELKQLPITKPYAHTHMDHVHIITYQQVLDANAANLKSKKKAG